MKKVDIEILRKQLNQLLKYVQDGGELQIEKQNVPIAKIVPIQTTQKNRTQLGIGKGTVQFLEDITESTIENDYEILSDN